jgi:HPt (histidine-containing phosphotransfer) domain-containing protein
MLIEFREQFIVEAPLIEAKIRAGELQIAERHLHTLKGAAGNLGAKVLHQACIALDTELVNGKYEPATLAHWQEALDKTMTAIATLQSEKASKFPTVAPNLTLQQLMAELDNLLADDGFISDELLMQLKKLLPEQQLPEYKVLTQLIMDTNYAKARTILNKLRGLPNE